MIVQCGGHRKPAVPQLKNNYRTGPAFVTAARQPAKPPSTKGKDQLDRQFKSHAERLNMIKQLGHINFFSDQVKALLDFYINKLGLTINFTLNDDQGQPFGWYVACGHRTFIEIFDQAGAVKKWGGQVAELQRGSQYRHLCFEVTDIAGYREKLIARGVSVSPVKTGMDRSLQAWTADPDGNAIELMEYTPESRQIS
jgi:catechol 2,3-dioxygenase-like lactoylglutathione lyase family enzyme